MDEAPTSHQMEVVVLVARFAGTRVNNDRRPLITRMRLTTGVSVTVLGLIR